MAFVLTAASTVLCGVLVPSVPMPPQGGVPQPPTPPSHGGTVTVTPPAPAKLTIQGISVLLQTSIQGMPITLCSNPPPPAPTVPCTLVTSVLPSGFASKLQLTGQGVALDSLAGVSNGSPPGNVPATAGQSKLTAV
jgi:hypothetical protein